MKIANKSQAENGVDNETIMTPLRVKQSIAANGVTPETQTDYDLLTNKPKINGVELTGNKTSSNLGLQPTLVSGTNIKTINNESLLGSGNITVGGGSGSGIDGVTLTSGNTSTDVTNTNNKAVIQLYPATDSYNPTTNKVLTEAALGDYTPTSGLASVATSGSYSDLSNTPSIPTKTSDLTNDSDFITSSYHDNTKVDILIGTQEEPINLNTISDGAYAISGYITKGDNTYSIDTTFYTVSWWYNNKRSVMFTGGYDIIKRTPSDGDYIYSIDDYVTYVDNSIYDELNLKQDTLVSGTNIKTINNETLLGSGNISIPIVGSGVPDFSDITTVYDTSYPLEYYNVIKDAFIIEENDYLTFIDANSVMYRDSNNQYNKLDGVIDGKQDTLVSGTNIKTINNTSILGSGNINISTSETDPVFTASAAYGITSNDITAWNNKSDFSGSYNDLTNKPTIPTVPTNVSAFTNDAGYITSYTETDPIYSASVAAGITQNDVDSWDAKQDALVSGTNIKTINNTSLLGSGDLSISTDTNVTYVDDNSYSNPFVISEHDKGVYIFPYTSTTIYIKLNDSASSYTTFNGNSILYLFNNNPSNLEYCACVEYFNTRGVRKSYYYRNDNVSSLLADDTYTGNFTYYAPQTDVGTLSSLTTTDKTSIVNAINEVNGKTSAPVILYYDASGTNGNVTLSDDASNYDYIEIFYTWETSNNGWNSTKIYEPDGKKAGLTLNYDNGTYYYIATSRYEISGTSMTLDSSVRWRFATGGANNTRTNTISSGGSVRVCKVVGYKY